MPKSARTHQQTKGAVLARERREREKKETSYNDALKDFIHIKYTHIIEEFEPVYERIMGRRPSHFVYTNTREFRRWRRRELHHEIHPAETQQVEQPVVEQEQVEQHNEIHQVEQEQVEQPLEQVEQPIEQDEQLVNLLHDEQLNELLQQIELPMEHLQDVPDPIVNEIEVRTDNDDDEGINLDAWEELQGDIREFDYRLEVELAQYLQ